MLATARALLVRARLTHVALGVLLWSAAALAAGSESIARHEEWQDIPYLVMETQGGSGHEPLPLVIALHASGSQPEALAPALAELPVRARIVLPCGSFERPTGRSWFPKGMGDLPASQQARWITAAEDRLSALITHVQERYPTEGRPLLTGISYGGDLSLLLLLHAPHAYSAAFPIAARLLPQWQLSAAACGDRCPPIHALHGRDDTTVPMAPTAAALQQLAAQGREVSIQGYAHTGHDFTAPMQADLRVAIAAQIRAATGGDKVREITRPPGN